jgi:hypothetical protein
MPVFQIFQLSMTPVAPESFVAESSFAYSGLKAPFSGRIIDCPDRNGEIQRLRGFIETRKFANFMSDGSFVVLHNGRDMYFREAFATFEATLRELQRISPSEFAAGKPDPRRAICDMKNAFCNKHGIYALLDRIDLIPFDEFARMAVPASRYYIGGILTCN